MQLKLIWTGNERDGFVATWNDMILYVNPFADGSWGWSVTTKQLQLVASHFGNSDLKQSSELAKLAAERAATSYANI